MNPHRFLTDPEMIRSAESIRRLDKDGYLYHMTSTWNYYDLPEMFQAIIDAGCSTFITKNPEGETLFCRNYDFSHYLRNDKANPRTGFNVVCHAQNPHARYRSLGVADAFWLDWRNGSYSNGCADDGKTDLTAMPMVPYVFMDGMNEEGLAISILALTVPAIFNETEYDTWEQHVTADSEPVICEEPGEMPEPKDIRLKIGTVVVNETDRKAWIVDKELVETKMPGKKAVLHPILMRLILDNCSTVDEAVAFASGFNVKAPMPGADYHIMIADKEGNSRLLEWIDDEMKVIPIDHVTNFRVSCEDEQIEKCGRDEVIKAGLYRARKNGMNETYAARLLSFVAQDPDNGIDRGKTQYTCIYNLDKKTLKVFSWGDFSESWDFTL